MNPLPQEISGRFRLVPEGGFRRKSSGADPGTGRDCGRKAGKKTGDSRCFAENPEQTAPRWGSRVSRRMRQGPNRRARFPKVENLIGFFCSLYKSWENGKKPGLFPERRCVCSAVCVIITFMETHCGTVAGSSGRPGDAALISGAAFFIINKRETKDV